MYARRAGPFKIFKKLGLNAYVIDPPVDYGFSPIFNIFDLIEFTGNIDETILPKDLSMMPLFMSLKALTLVIKLHQFSIINLP